MQKLKSTQESSNLMQQTMSKVSDAQQIRSFVQKGSIPSVHKENSASKTWILELLPPKSFDFDQI